ncbi:MAG: chemotaxis protein CheX [Actinomycetota bacterium]
MTDQALTPGAVSDHAEPLIDPMELEAIIVEVLDALVMNAGMDLDTPIPDEPGVDASPIHGTIVVHADTEAMLVIETDAQVCAKLARCWGLIGDDGATTQDATDALGELCNLVGATVKTVFEEESHVGIPEVVNGPAPAWDVEDVPVFHATGQFTARFGPNQA